MNQTLVGYQPEFPGAPGVAPLAERSIVNPTGYLSFDAFRQIFELKAGKDWPEVARLFREYGVALSLEFVSAVMYAEEDGRLDWCLGLLRQHLEDDLGYQHPQARGRIVLGSAPANRSVMFLLNDIIRVLRPQLFKED